MEAEVNGRLVSDSPYLGLANNGSAKTGYLDYFKILLDLPGTIVIDLTGHPLASVEGVMLQLFYESSDNSVALIDSFPYHIEYEGDAGTYYLLVFNEVEKCPLVGIGCSAYYTVIAVFPLP